MTEPADSNAVPPEDSGAEYPAQWTADVVMSNGRTCRIRAIQPSDKEALDNFFESLSADSIHMRYFEENRDLAKRDAERLVQADHSKLVALVAIAKDQIVGIGNYDRLDHVEAEIAFAVRDAYQGLGLGALLLEHLAAVARERGVHRFRAEVLAANRKMLGTFESSGYKPTSTVDSTVMVIDFDINPTPEIREIAARREHKADALSVRHIFQPRSVAVWATDLSDNSPGGTALKNILDGEYRSRVYAVHQDATDIGDAKGYPDLRSIGEQVDLVVMAGTPEEIEQRIPDCSEVNIETAVVLTGGFRESMDMTRQQELTQAFREAGVRVVGPNALGVINTDPRHQLNASVSGSMPARGRVGLYCHTSAFGQALLKMIERRGLGISTFLAAGNRVDVAANDVMQYWEDDPATSVVLVYLESMNNPRKFLRLASRLAGKKPVVCVLSGRRTQSTPVGEARRSTDLPGWAIDELLKDSGVMRVDSANEMLDLANLLTLQPEPKGPGVGIVSDSIALGELAGVAARAVGLDPLSDLFLIPSDPTAEEVENALQLALSDPSVHSVIVSHAPNVYGKSDVVAEAVIQASRSATKPIVAVMLAGRSEPMIAGLDANGLPNHGSVPVFGRVEDAVNALRAVVDYGKWLKRPKGKSAEFRDIERAQVDAIVAKEFESRDNPLEVKMLSQGALEEILAAYGIDVLPSISVASEDSAAIAANQVGYPVVLKVADERLHQRLDFGAVRLSLENELTLRTAYLSMLANLPDDEYDQLVLQPMAPPGVPVALEANEDELFGPVISFRMGGEVAEVLEDRAYHILPLTNREASELIRAPKASSILTERASLRHLQPGRKSIDSVPVIPNLEALEELVQRFAMLKDDFPEIASLKLNPVMVHEHGVAVIGARGFLARTSARTDLEARRLR